MPTNHLDQARRSYRAYQLLRDEGFVDWAATALFYTALHVVDGWLQLTFGTTPESHRARDRWLSRASIPAEVEDAYADLHSVSHTVRYRDWTAILDGDRLAALLDGPYRLVCEHFDAPDAIVPD